MNASKAKITAGVAVLVLATVGGLSTIGVRIHQRRALAAAIGPLGFADLTAASANTAPASPADPAARSEIEADYKRIIDGFNNGDVTPLASVSAPDIRIWSTTNPKSPSGNQPNFSTSPGAQMKSMDGGRWSRMGEILQGHPDMKGSLTLTSLTVHSNQAVGVSNMRWAAMANGQDHAPTGSILTLDETDEFDWQYRGGRWVIVKIVTLSQATHAV